MKNNIKRLKFNCCFFCRKIQFLTIIKFFSFKCVNFRNITAETKLEKIENLQRVTFRHQILHLDDKCFAPGTCSKLTYIILHFSIELWKIKNGSLKFDENVGLDFKIGYYPIVFPISYQTENTYISHFNMTNGNSNIPNYSNK